MKRRCKLSEAGRAFFTASPPARQGWAEPATVAGHWRVTWDGVPSSRVLDGAYIEFIQPEAACEKFPRVDSRMLRTRAADDMRAGTWGRA